MMTLNDFITKYCAKNKATSNKKSQKVISSFSLNDVGFYLRDGLFSSDIGIVNLHPLKEHIGFVIYMKTTLMVMGLSVQRNYLNLL